MPPSIPVVPDSALPAAAVRALQQGNTIEAIKALREAQGIGLKEAKDAVDAYAAAHPGVQLKTSSAPPGVRVLVGAVILAVVVAIAYLVFMRA